VILDGKLQLTDVLGTGAYGVVYGAIDLKTGAQYAVKCLSKFNADGTPLDRRQFAFQKREIRLHYEASEHPNVVSMLKIVDRPDCIYVVLEYCPEGDLFFNITERGQYVGKDELSKRVFLQILDAVEHCHNRGIYHRDLKPENILVTDNGETVKLADFGLATSSPRSDDYGCGSTFYMSPECLDHAARKPYYLCAPNDVWSLGVILVNLTCGRNPWKQASIEDSTYRAYSRDPDFLKTILPLTDGLNDILRRIFTQNPEQRISLADLRERILACPRFTVPAVPACIRTPPASPEPTTQYVDDNEDAIIDDADYDTALSPASTESVSSDEGSLTSSVESVEDLEDDLMDDHEEQQQHHYVSTQQCQPHTFEPEEAQMPMFPNQEYVANTYTGPVPGPTQGSMAMPASVVPVQVNPVPVAVPVQPQPCVQKSFNPWWWGVVKYAQQVPVLQPHVPFHHQVPLFAAL
jgi:serine/threonine protein kinase